MEDVAEIISLLADVSGKWNEVIEKRQRFDELLQTAIANNGERLQKLRSLADKGQHLPTGKTGAVSVRKKLEDVLKRVMVEVTDIGNDRVLNTVIESSKSNTVKYLNGLFPHSNLHYLKM
jgi:uncharacterized protein with NRDE domain